MICKVYPSLALAQVTIEQTQEMSCGSMISLPNGYTIRLRPNGQINSSNGSDLLGGDRIAVFRVQGPRNSSISYSFSSNNNLATNGQTITLTNFETNRGNPFNLPGSGIREINVGASLIIPPNINGGTFAGSFILTIDNQ